MNIYLTFTILTAFIPLINTSIIKNAMRRNSGSIIKPLIPTETTNKNEPVALGSPHFLVHGLEPRESELEKADNYLKWFVRDLRDFVTNKDFDYVEFETQIEDLRRDLFDIEFSVEKESHNDELEDQLIFARRLYQEMVEATEKIQRYKSCQARGHTPLLRMFKLKLRVLVLHNYRGKLDCLIPRYEDKIFCFLQQLNHWERDMGKLRHVPSGMLRLFDAQYVEVRKILDNLKSQFSLCE